MTPAVLAERYRAYVDCLNRRDWTALDGFVDPALVYNGEAIGADGYNAMLEKNARDIPDLTFRIELLVAEPPGLASRLAFDCHPTGAFLGLPVDGRRLRFAENVFYRFAGERIAEVWSVLDKAAIEAQL